MIAPELFKHQWLKAFRAQGYYKNLIVNIFVGFFALYMATIFIVLGFTAHEILEEVAPGQPSAETFNQVLLYVLFAMLILRYFMQPLNSINLQPYQVAPIKRNTLVNYILLKPLLNPVNYVTLLFAIPFALRSVSKVYGSSGALFFVLVALFLIWFNTLMAAYLKRRFGSNVWGSVGALALVGIMIALEYFKVLSLLAISKNVFGFLLSNSFGWLMVLLLPVSAYLLNRLFFARNYYAENFNEKLSKRREYGKSFSFMERFGKTGELIALELKLILRHKRTKSILFMSVIFLAYGLLFYPSKSFQSNNGMMFFVAMFVTGIFMLMYGQWIISWDGGYFDFLMTKNIDTHTYIQANYYLLIAFNVLSFVLTTPYFLFGKTIVLLHLSAFLYNLGVNTIFYLLVAPYNTKRLDLSKGSAMNYQGTTYKNFLYVIPMMIFPIILISVFNIFGLNNVALIVLASLGLLGLLFRKPLLTTCVKHFLHRKYALCEGFRKKE